MKGGKLGIGMGQAVRSPSDIGNALVLLVTPGQWYGAAHTRQLRRCTCGAKENTQ
jgi:hypothetical protein